MQVAGGTGGVALFTAASSLPIKESVTRPAGEAESSAGALKAGRLTSRTLSGRKVMLGSAQFAGGGHVRVADHTVGSSAREAQPGSGQVVA